MLDATGWRSGAGVPAAAPPLAERAHDTHSDRGRGTGGTRHDEARMGGDGVGGFGSGAGVDAHLGERTRKATWEQ